jgi:hypothetical protein
MKSKYAMRKKDAGILEVTVGAGVTSPLGSECFKLLKPTG